MSIARSESRARKGGGSTWNSSLDSAQIRVDGLVRGLELMGM